METANHTELKRLAINWARANGFGIVATEVSLPHLACRVDVAAYRAENTRVCDPRTKRNRSVPTIGATAVFECKQSRSDFLSDSRCAAVLTERLQKLHALRALYEESMQVHMPSLRCSDALFPEFDTFRYEAAGFEPYDYVTSRIRRLAGWLHRQTKFDDLQRWGAANLHFLVADPGVVREHELPTNWGLLVRDGEQLTLKERAVWQEVAEPQRLSVLVRIAQAATRRQSTLSS
jgi:hypothetical protein